MWILWDAISQRDGFFIQEEKKKSAHMDFLWFRWFHLVIRLLNVSENHANYAKITNKAIDSMNN